LIAASPAEQRLALGASAFETVDVRHGPSARAGRICAVVPFFVPTADTAEQAEEIWKATKRFAEEQTGWDVSDRRIFRIEYEHHGEQEWAQVGEFYSVAEADGDLPPTCLVILESQSFLVCTLNRGVARGMPYLVELPTAIFDFD
jgi:hypothetical protein